MAVIVAKIPPKGFASSNGFSVLFSAAVCRLQSAVSLTVCGDNDSASSSARVIVGIGRKDSDDGSQSAVNGFVRSQCKRGE
jgi:hypothetical protein